MSEEPRTKFLPHVNGIRTIAILGILFYHLDNSGCPSGYLGVDLFLVISGYFLMGNLMKPALAERFHYGDFLMKKAWRIIPSWFVVSVIICIAAHFLMLYKECLAAIVTVRFSSLFITDYFLDYYYDYFNPSSQSNPLLHFWYLSITAQLYLITPLLLIPLARWYSRKAALVMLFIVGLASLVFHILATAPFIPADFQETILGLIFAKGAYYHLVPRFWEVAAGYTILTLPSLQRHLALRGFLGLLSFVIIICLFFIPIKSSLPTYVMVLCSVLLLKYGDTMPTHRLLSLKGVQFLGTISFSLYLWHWPVMVIWKYFCFTPPTPIDKLGMLLVSLVLAWLSWRWVESIRIPDAKRGRNMCLILSLPVLYVASILYPCISSSTHPNNNSRAPHAPIDEEKSSYHRDDALLAGLDASVLKQKPIYLGQNKSISPTFLIVGDSHAHQLHRCADLYCTSNNMRGIYMNNTILGVHKVGNSCMKRDTTWSEKRVEALMHYLQSQPSVKYVVLAIWWEYRVLENEKILHPDAQKMEEEFRQGLRETARRLQDMGKQLIVMSDSPSIPEPGPLEEWHRMNRLFPYEVPERVIKLSDHLTRQQWVPGLLQELKNEGVIQEVVDMGKPLLRGNHYLTQHNGEFLFWDSNHLTIYGQDIVVPMLMDELRHIFNKDSAFSQPPEAHQKASLVP